MGRPGVAARLGARYAMSVKACECNLGADCPSNAHDRATWACASPATEIGVRYGLLQPLDLCTSCKSVLDEKWPSA